MADLCRCWTVCSMNLSIKNQPAANARSDCDVEDASRVARRAKTGFGECGHITVVAEFRRDAKFLLCPIDQWKIVPASNLMAGLHDPLVSEDRPPKSIGRALDWIGGNQFATDLSNLVANSLTASRKIHVSSFERDEVRSVPSPDAELKLRPTDFNAKKHRLGQLRASSGERELSDDVLTDGLFDLAIAVFDCFVTIIIRSRGATACEVTRFRKRKACGSASLKSVV